MSGTSVDGIDAALVNIEGDKCTFIGAATCHYSSEVRHSLLALNDSPTITLAEFINLDLKVASTFAETAVKLLRKCTHDATDIVAIGSHGQTIYHQPNVEFAGTLQIGDPNTIAQLTSIDVVADFRRADMARGGQGAPLAPAFHHYVLGASSPRVVLNLGGIANISILDKHVVGYDTGPANTLIDAWCQKTLNIPFDKNGDWSSQGNIQQNLLDQMLQDPYFASHYPKSTGKDYFNLTWLDKYCDTTAYRAQDIQATLVELSAVSISDAIHSTAANVTEVYVCGGGARNNYLMRRLKLLLAPKQIALTNALGVDADACEAMAFAWLAYRHKSGLSGNLPSVTGAKEYAVLGGLYPHQ